MSSERTSFVQRKTKGQQLKGKIVRHFLALFGTFPHFFALFLQDFFVELRGFTIVLVRRKEKIIKENKKEKDQTILHVSCCTFVLLRFVRELSLP